MGTWVHRMVETDEEAMTGVCAACGPVRVVRKAGRLACRDAVRQWRGRASGSRSSARKYRLKKGPVCERCGFVPVDPCQLDVHHRDGDHSNHADENLETLCANCHRLEKPTTRR